jgi:hypothetical protein
MKIRVSNSLFVILVSAVLWQPVSAAADSMILPPVCGNSAICTRAGIRAARNCARGYIYAPE